MSLHVLVAGGTGLIGRNLVNKLETDGHKVTILSRTHGGSNTITWEDLKKTGLPDGVDSVVSLCGSNMFNSRKWNPEIKAEIHRSRTETNKILVDQIMKCNVKPSSFILGTALSIYPMIMEGAADEYTKKTDNSYLPNLIEDWEKSTELPEDCVGVRRIILRIGFTFHTTEGGAFDTIVRQYKRYMGATMGSGQQYTSWVHIDDLVGIMIHAMTNKDVCGILNGVSPNDVTMGEFTSMLAKKLNRPNFFRMPEFMIKWMMGNERAEGILYRRKVYPRRTLETGYKFKFEKLNEALDDLLKAYN